QFKLSRAKTKNVFDKDVKDLFEASGASQLDERFTAALLRNDVRDKEWIKAILRLLTVGIRELGLDELQAAIQIGPDDGDWSFMHFLENECGSFLHILPNVGESATVQLIHETFATFLIDRKRCKPIE